MSLPKQACQWSLSGHFQWTRVSQRRTKHQRACWLIVWFCVTCKAVLFSKKKFSSSQHTRAMTSCYHCPSRAILGVGQWKGYLGKEQREEECVKIVSRVFGGHSNNSIEQTRFWEANSSAAKSRNSPSLRKHRVKSAHPLSLSCAKWIQPTVSSPISLRLILMFSAHLYPSLSVGLFPPGFLTKIIYAFLFAPVRSTLRFPVILFNYF